MPDRPSPAELETILSFLESQSTLALATVNADGKPQVAPLFYVSDEALNLYWLSSSGSRHSINLAAHPQVAATIYPVVWHWTEIRGVQIEGAASAMTDETTHENILKRYRAKFALPAVLDAQITASTLYVLRPRWLRWLDNSIRFGYKAEIVF